MSSAFFDHSANELDSRQPGQGDAQGIRVALISSDPRLIDSLTRALDSDGHFSLEVLATDSPAIKSSLLSHPVHFVIIDLEPPTNICLRVMSRLSALYPATQLMVLMSRRSLDAACVAVQAGAQSCLLKETSGSDDVIAALHGLAAGSNAISPSIARVLINRFRQLH